MITTTYDISALHRDKQTDRQTLRGNNNAICTSWSSVTNRTDGHS